MNYREFVEGGVLQELTDVFTSELRSRALLRSVGFALHYSPPFGSDFWPSVCEDISHGAIRGGLDTLLAEAARQFPGNPVFTRNSHDTATPTTSIHSGATATPTSVRFVECPDPTALLDAVRTAAVRLQIAAEINVGYVLGTSVCLHIDTSAEDALRMATAALSGKERLARLVAVHPFADRMLEQLYVEGPDQGHFSLKEVPASTRTHQIVRGVMDQYSDDMWPRDRRGRVRRPVVDHVKPDGTVERLPPDATLHDAGVEDGDTLQVTPESVAGGGTLGGFFGEFEHHRRPTESFLSSDPPRRTKHVLVGPNDRDLTDVAGRGPDGGGGSGKGNGGSGEGGGGDDSGGGARPDRGTVRRFPDVMCPEQVSYADRFPVTVALYSQPTAGSAVDAALTVRRHLLVDVTIEAHGFEVLGSAHHRISTDDNAAPAVFELRASRIGYGSVILDFQQGGNPLGAYTIAIEVVGGSVARTASAHRHRGLDIPDDVEPPDYILRISYDAVEPRVLRFSLRAKDDFHEGRGFKPVALSSAPEAYARQLYEAFDLMRQRVDPVTQRERGASRGVSGSEIAERLRRVGHSLWQKLIPADLKEFYDQHRRQLADRSLVILSDEPALPWELLWPYGDGWKDDGPWCLTMRLARWLRRDEQGYGGDGPPSRLRLRRMTTLIPTDSGLPHARAEADFLREFEARNGVRDGGVTPPIKASVMSALEAGDYDWLHAAAHGQFTTSGIAPLWLEHGEALTPEEIVGPGIEDHIRTCRPAFVLNACDLGVAGWSLTGMSGWANQLLKVGAGMFLAPLWQVSDSVAACFVTTFYEELAREQRVADAMRAARWRAREVLGDPSWMSYVLYAHPNARVVIEPGAMEDIHA